MLMLPCMRVGSETVTTDSSTPHKRTTDASYGSPDHSESADQSPVAPPTQLTSPTGVGGGGELAAHWGPTQNWSVTTIVFPGHSVTSCACVEVC